MPYAETCNITFSSLYMVFGKALPLRFYHQLPFVKAQVIRHALWWCTMNMANVVYAAKSWYCFMMHVSACIVFKRHVSACIVFKRHICAYFVFMIWVTIHAMSVLVTKRKTMPFWVIFKRQYKMCWGKDEIKHKCLARVAQYLTYLVLMQSSAKAGSSHCRLDQSDLELILLCATRNV